MKGQGGSMAVILFLNLMKILQTKEQDVTGLTKNNKLLFRQNEVNCIKALHHSSPSQSSIKALHFPYQIYENQPMEIQ
jgi:hypothetical protein